MDGIRRARHWQSMARVCVIQITPQWEHLFAQGSRYNRTGGLLDNGSKEIYVMNGFFMAMRSKFTSPDSSIYYFNCEWDPSVLAWADFRGKVLGPTDPAQAPPESLRGQIYKNWKDMQDIPRYSPHCKEAAPPWPTHPPQANPCPQANPSPPRANPSHQARKRPRYAIAIIHKC